MKALVWEGPRIMVMRDVEVPTPGPGEVTVKVGYAGICGSELSGYLGHNALRVPPLIMGHEFAGEIASLTPEVQARRPELHEGQRVTVNPLYYCGDCEWCRSGATQLCANRSLLGAHRPGAFAPLISVPSELVVPLPEQLTNRAGALAEPVAVGIRIATRLGNVAGESVLIIGAGPIGLLALQALQVNGAGRVFITDLDEERLAMARELGGETLDARGGALVETVRHATAGRGVVGAVDAVGTARTRLQCVSATRSGGTVVLSGLHEESSEMPAADIIRREINVCGSFAYSADEFRSAVDRLANGSVRLDPWIVEASLEEGGYWFDRLIESPGGVAKVLLVPSS